jgi:hypothetical protein
MRETSMVKSIRSICFLPVNGFEYLGSPRAIAGFLAIRIPKGGTNMFFKRLEQRKHDIIHTDDDDDDDDDDNSNSINVFCRAQFKESPPSE